MGWVNYMLAARARRKWIAVDPHYDGVDGEGDIQDKKNPAGHLVYCVEGSSHQSPQVLTSSLVGNDDN